MDGAQSASGVRSLLLPLQHAAVLVPYSVVQEIIAWRLPNVVENAPAWLLGVIPWRRWRLPVISGEALLGGTFSRPSRKAHIVVCNLLIEDDHLPCVGIVTQGVPQLVRADLDNIFPMPVEEVNPVVSEFLRFRDTEAWIPDLPALASKLASVLT